MAAELKYNGEWLIPLQDGYRVEYPAGGTVRPPAITVSASYRLTDAAMIAWWWSLYEANRGTRWTAMLDTAGYQATHNCVMLDRPESREFQGHTAVVTIRWQCFASAPVTTGYITSWIYPVSISDDSTGSADWRGAQELGAYLDDSVGAAIIVSGMITEPVKNATYDTESTNGTGAIVSGYINEPVKSVAYGTESALGAGSIVSGVIDTVAIYYDLRTFDTERTTGAGVITGGSIS